MAREVLALGHHAEVYAGLDELAKHPPHTGIIVAREDSAPGGVPDILARLHAMTVALPLVVASESGSVGHVVEVIRSGAIDYLHLPVAPDQLGAMLARVAARAPRETVLRRRMIEARQRLAELSEREREVLDLLVEGESNKHIARALAISPRTVEIHRANMMKKLDAAHVVQAVRLWFNAHGEAIGPGAA
ncbi:MAG: LuxR C-terminal-related transcriptional regulator [Candidatus Andeanibacterium colombiense]|uniref:LuxR C-terminal-related transcriptional regulator n=1 Tax=Candidatus Andeanibacterium colombiense TaxID=3121345 RepID=A0AAJ5X635_9SPHN|nr:MAG: LuxR C-terminal-related transcriptional regulator [Sphingomonadaceae bacterium]